MGCSCAVEDILGIVSCRDDHRVGSFRGERERVFGNDGLDLLPGYPQVARISERFRRNVGTEPERAHAACLPGRRKAPATGGQVGGLDRFTATRIAGPTDHCRGDGVPAVLARAPGRETIAPVEIQGICEAIDRGVYTTV